MDVNIRAPRELGLHPGYGLRNLNHYMASRSGLHWYLTYMSHHLESLFMTHTRADPCVLISQKNDFLDGLIILQVYESLGLGSPEFME